MTTTAVLVIGAGYLIGSIPFGYVIGRLRGVDLFQAGSGNIGATNVGRTLGWGYGILAFALDFLKGAAPVVAAGLISGYQIPANLIQVLVAAAAFVGHLFPIWLGFRGGKGVATGAGTAMALVPIPAAFALSIWVLTLLVTRIVSVASLAAVTGLSVSFLLTVPAPFAQSNLPVTLYLLVGTVIVFVKHRSNLKRLASHTESRIGDSIMRQSILRAVHLLAVGFWFGGMGFFNFVVAPTIFTTFDEVVRTSPSDRTAGYPILPAGASAEDLGKALAGAAVGPVFPKYFAMQAICGVTALMTALAWWRFGGVNRFRVGVIVAALVVVGVSWPISTHVSDVRVARFSPDSEIAAAAKVQFHDWHLVSLGLSFVSLGLAGLALALGAKLPAPEGVRPGLS